MADADTQLAVIGAGPGGYAAAFLAADLGLRVTLIDPEADPGGVCLYRGCIPSKTLLHVAAQINEARSSKERGVVFGAPKIQPSRLRAWKDEVVARLTGGLGQLVKQRGIDYRQGKAVFRDERTLEIEDAAGGSTRLVFGHAVIATGSRARSLPFGPDGDERLMDATDALDLGSVSGKMLVVGGGYIGLEMGTVYAALGTAVTVVEMTGGLLPGVDRDLVAVLRKRMEGEVEAILLETTVTEIKAQKNGLRVVLEAAGGEARTRIFDRVLVAVGRRPNSYGLGLENTGVEIDGNGFVRVDGQQRTAVENIFAIGDVTGEPMLAHRASHQGRVAAEAAAGRKVFYDPAAVPAVVFTDPEIAWSGLTESQAKEKGIPHAVSRFPWAASGRAATLGRTEGVTKLVFDPDTERILGVGIAGVGAGELIALGTLAIEMGANATDLGLTIHPHPTLSETLMEAAHGLHGTATHYRRPQRKKG